MINKAKDIHPEQLLIFSEKIPERPGWGLNPQHNAGALPTEIPRVGMAQPFHVYSFAFHVYVVFLEPDKQANLLGRRQR